MAASTANRMSAVSRKHETVKVPVKAATHIYQYTHVMAIAGTGYAIPAADTANGTYLGLALQEVDNTVGTAADGTLDVNVQLPRPDELHEFDASSAAQTWVGKLVCFSDDHTVALASTTTNDVYAGRVVRYISSTKVLVNTADRWSTSTTGIVD